MPLLGSIAAGVLVIGGCLVWGAKVKAELHTAQETEKEKIKERDELQKEKEAVDELQRQIDEQRARQDTIIDISQSKVMWSLKLAQLGEIMNSFDDFWIERITLSKGTRAQLTMDCAAIGYNLDEIARFRDDLKYDPNFSYHFDGLLSRGASRIELVGYLNAEQKAQFSVQLPLVQAVTPKKKRGKK